MPKRILLLYYFIESNNFVLNRFHKWLWVYWSSIYSYVVYTYFLRHASNIIGNWFSYIFFCKCTTFSMIFLGIIFCPLCIFFFSIFYWLSFEWNFNIAFKYFDMVHGNESSVYKVIRLQWLSLKFIPFFVPLSFGFLSFGVCFFRCHTTVT